MASMFKKIKTILKDGVEPFIEGVDNYKLDDPIIEKEAIRRAKICNGCEFYKDEPISFLKIADSRTPILHHKMCGDCSCALPFLARQNQKICVKWQKSLNTSKRIAE